MELLTVMALISKILVGLLTVDRGVMMIDMAIANLARMYNYVMAFSVNPMHSVEQHLDVLTRAERAYNF